jgi:hypothetical protein
MVLAMHWTKEQLGDSPQIKFCCTMTHVYTHLCWNLEIFDAEWHDKTPPKELIGGVWLLPAEEKKLPRVAFIRQLNLGE